MVIIVYTGVLSWNIYQVKCSPFDPQFSNIGEIWTEFIHVNITGIHYFRLFGPLYSNKGKYGPNSYIKRYA
jgi:hypothetical protein